MRGDVHRWLQRRLRHRERWRLDVGRDERFSLICVLRLAAAAFASKTSAAVFGKGVSCECRSGEGHGCASERVTHGRRRGQGRFRRGRRTGYLCICQQRLQTCCPRDRLQPVVEVEVSAKLELEVLTMNAVTSVMGSIKPLFLDTDQRVRYPAVLQTRCCEELKVTC